jgi:hypothetical protein
MTLDVALRATKILMALCFLQQSAEHMMGAQSERLLFGLRAALSVALLARVASPWPLPGLLGLALLILRRFQAPWNGGSDRMGLLIVCCLCAARLALPHLAEVIFACLAFQLTLSYFMSHWVKIRNPDWRRGKALVDVFRFSADLVSHSLRGWAAGRLRGWADRRIGRARCAPFHGP